MAKAALPKVEPMRLETYVAVVKNAAGSKMFQTFYAKVEGSKQDIMRKGDLSCAFFVSFVLTGLGLAQRLHGTVNGTVGDLKKSGWRRTKKLAPGCVIEWSAVVDNRGESHKHIGFYIGDGKAVSNSSKARVPRIHPYRLKGRDIVGMYKHPKLK